MELPNRTILIAYSCLFFILLHCNSFAQNSKIDSLLTLLKIQKEDTAKVNLLNNLCWEYVKTGEYEPALRIGNEALQLTTVILNLNQGGEIINQTAQRQQAKALNNIGSVYREQGNFSKGLEYFLKALKISEKSGNRGNVASNLGNIGLVYYNQGNNTKALKYFHKALYLLLPAVNSRSNDNTPDKSNAAAIYGNIGNVYKEMGDKSKIHAHERDSLFNKALENYEKALIIKEELRDLRGIAIWLGNIGGVYKEQGDFPKALEYYLKALKIHQETGNKTHLASVLGEIGSLYTSLKKYREAEYYILKAISLTDSIGAMDIKKDQLSFLSTLFFEKGEYKSAYEYFQLYSIAKDSVFNEEKSNEIIRQEMNYSFERKEAAAQAAHDKQAAVAAEVNKNQKIIIWLTVLGLLLTMTLAGYIFRSLRFSDKQKHIIELQKNEVSRQKEMVEKHQEEIIDSINYAKRLQDAILPPFSLIKNSLPDSFVLYLPKDIVAGDFYWAHLSSGNKLIFAVADCTGHGIPGAFMSMVGNSLLNKIVIENKIEEPDKILNQLKLGVIQTLKQTGATRDQKDGMDIALCVWEKPLPDAYSHNENISAGRLNFSGAHNPLYHFRNGIFTEYRGEKQTIGYEKGKINPFSKHTIELIKGDTFYIFTDGFADQKGGKKGRKYYNQALRELFVFVQKLGMEDQLNYIKKTFEDWKGEFEQVDDICVVGFRV